MATISIKDWISTQPIGFSDAANNTFYTKLSNNLLKILYREFNKYEVSSTDAPVLAIILANYVEDTVNGIGIFETFRRHTLLTDSRLIPFYDVKDGVDYFRDEVNFEDVRFLLWCHFQEIRGNEAILSPDNETIAIIARSLMDELNRAYEEAPDNELLRKFFFNPQTYTDYYEVKDILHYLITKGYITKCEAFADIVGETAVELMDKLPSMFPDMAIYASTSTHLLSTKSDIAALHPNQWLATMLEINGMEKESRDIRQIDHTGYKSFHITGKDSTTLTTTDDKGQQYIIDSSSANLSEAKPGQSIFTTLVRYSNELWNINGFASVIDDDMRHERKTEVDGPEACKYYLEKIGDRIAFFANFDDMATKLGLPESKLDATTAEYLRQPVTAFLNTDGTISLSTAITPSLPHPANPYFKGIDKSTLLGAIANDNVASPELLKYMKEQGYLDSLGLTSSISEERGKALLHCNMGFISTFFRSSIFQ